MVFSSLIFLWTFLPLCLFLYYISKPNYRNIILVVASSIFYAWGGASYLLLMITLICINYIFGILVSENISISINSINCKINAKYILITGIILNLLLLGYFKCFNAINRNVYV